MLAFVYSFDCYERWRDSNTLFCDQEWSVQPKPDRDDVPRPKNATADQYIFKTHQMAILKLHQ